MSYRLINNIGLFSIALVIAIVAGLFFPAAGPGPVRAENNPEVIRIATPAWAKLTAKDGSGLYFDLLRKIYGPAGVKLEYQIAPWKRAKAMIRRGEADAMLAAYRTPPEDGWIYPNKPMDVDQIMAVVRREAMTDWRGTETLGGRRVVWLRGYNFQNYIKADMKWREVDNAKQGWTMVARGRADAYLDILPEVTHYLKNNPDQTGLFRIEEALAINTYLRFADRPKSRKLIETYDRRMAELLGTKELIELYRSWEQAYPDFNPTP